MTRSQATPISSQILMMEKMIMDRDDEIERLREALAELYATDLAPRDANHGRAWQNALRKAEAALRKPEDV